MDWKPFIEVSGEKNETTFTYCEVWFIFPVLHHDSAVCVASQATICFYFTFTGHLYCRQEGRDSSFLPGHMYPSGEESVLVDTSERAVLLSPITPSDFQALLWHQLLWSLFHITLFTLSGREGSSFKYIFCCSFVEDALSGPNPPCLITPSPVFLSVCFFVVFCWFFWGGVGRVALDVVETRSSNAKWIYKRLYFEVNVKKK